jgi:hypothetical protein
MMAEQKGRGGKKPKYQIADIGGSDLTPQDLSTERVLNFLIKGEAASVDQGLDPALDDLGAQDSQEHPLTEREEVMAETSLPSPENRGKKSLDHLFKRASGGGGAGKDLKLDLHGQEQSAPIPDGAEIGRAEPTVPALSITKAESESARSEQSLRPVVTKNKSTSETQPSPQDARPQDSPQTVDSQEITADDLPGAAPESAELTQLISLWKSFYRLKDGEIDALKVMYQMSHGQGSAECHVKMHKLAEMSNLTYRYCQKVVRSLEQLGWITKLNDYDPTTRLGVLYRVNLKPSI